MPDKTIISSWQLSAKKLLGPFVELALEIPSCAIRLPQAAGSATASIKWTRRRFLPLNPFLACTTRLSPVPAPRPKRGEVWQTDLGLAAKSRPVLVLGMPGPDDRQIFTYIPHTTQLRGTEYEVSLSIGFLEPGGFDAQGISTVQTVKLSRRLGILNADQIREVEDAVLRWLEIEC